MKVAPRPARHLWARGSPWRAVSLPVAASLGSVGAIAAIHDGLPVLIGAGAGAAAGLLGVLLLPSFPTRRVVVILLGLGGLGALRHASFSGSDTSWLLVLWAASTLVALLMVDRADAEQVQPLPQGEPLANRAGEIARVAVAVAVMAAVVVVALGPTITQHLGRHQWPGLTPSLGNFLDAPSSLRATNNLDMTQRPRLSDRVVFTVDASRPSFWRGQTFDIWNGHEWSRSEMHSTTVLPEGGAVSIAPQQDDAGAFTGQPMRQTFHIEAGFSNVVFAAPSLVSIETDKAVQRNADGTATVFGAFGRGSTYTVTSQRVLATASVLRAADTRPVPAEVRRQFAQAPETTKRVVALARRITAPAPTTYDKILAIEAWLGANVRYSLNAPLAPKGVDVVDDFLFRSRLGWCEQVASSLVVMARSVGIPARLATGFVSGQRDALTGQFVVRERDAHAWAEIYFPGVGWQPFDPTASVPLAGNATASGSWLSSARHHALELGLIAFALVCVAVGAPDLIARLRRRLARRHASWAARNLTRLERIGRRAGRARDPAETPREYAAALAVHLQDDRLRVVGETLDADGFSSAGTSPSARAAADAVLSSL